MILYFSGTGNRALACICGCPTKAIEYGKHSIGLERYTCPKNEE